MDLEILLDGTLENKMNSKGDDQRYLTLIHNIHYIQVSQTIHNDARTVLWNNIVFKNLYS